MGKKYPLMQIEAKEHVLSIQALLCLILKKDIAPELAKLTRENYAKAEWVNDYLGEVAVPE